jgi:hypothetical protein
MYKYSRFEMCVLIVLVAIGPHNADTDMLAYSSKNISLRLLSFAVAGTRS